MVTHKVAWVHCDSGWQVRDMKDKCLNTRTKWHLFVKHDCSLRMTFCWQCDLQRVIYSLNSGFHISHHGGDLHTPIQSNKHEQMQHKYIELLIFHKDGLCTVPHDSPKFPWGLPTLLSLIFFWRVTVWDAFLELGDKAFCVKRSSHPWMSGPECPGHDHRRRRDK